MMIHRGNHWHVQCDECQSFYPTAMGGTTSSRQRIHAERQLRILAQRDGWTRERINRAYVRHTCEECVARLREERA